MFPTIAIDVCRLHFAQIQSAAYVVFTRVDGVFALLFWTVDFSSPPLAVLRRPIAKSTWNPKSPNWKGTSSSKPHFWKGNKPSYRDLLSIVANYLGWSSKYPPPPSLSPCVRYCTMAKPHTTCLKCSVGLVKGGETSPKVREFEAKHIWKIEVQLLFMGRYSFN